MSVERARLALRAVDLAPRLLGAVIVSRIGSGVDPGATGEVAVRLTEVEAYEGADDPASHAFRGPTARNAVMFGLPGHLYCYFTYGMHWCANIVCGPDGTASAVLLRAGEVIAGQDLAQSRRPAARNGTDLARGPARLAACLGLNRDTNGVDLCDPTSPVRLVSLPETPSGVERGPRVGIVQAADRPWRFWLPDEATVSAYRPAVRRRRG